jgi:hypothetical protein
MCGITSVSEGVNPVTRERKRKNQRYAGDFIQQDMVLIVLIKVWSFG